jgi:hypothetical protein
MQLSTEKLRRIEGRNAALQAELRAAKRKIRSLEREVGRSRAIRPDQVELDLLSHLAECDINDGFAVNFAADMELTPAKLDYHLQRLVDGGYVELLFTDSALGDSFTITQKGRLALVKKHLI